MIIQRLPLTVATATGSLAVEGDEKPLTAFDRWLQGGYHIYPRREV